MSGLRVVFVAVALSSSSAVAWPVDWAHDVAAGSEKFVKLPRLDWVEVEDPSVVEAEWLGDSGELLLTARKPGRTVLLLAAEGKVAAWSVTVGPPQPPGAQRAAVKKACPDATWTPDDDVQLTVTVKDEACAAALKALFQTDAVEARRLELTFLPATLQAQLKAVEASLRALRADDVTARYVGAGLVLEGHVSQALHRRVLWAVFRATLGRLALDDRLEEPPPADAGVPSP